MDRDTGMAEVGVAQVGVAQVGVAGCVPAFLLEVEAAAASWTPMV